MLIERRTIAPLLFALAILIGGRSAQADDPLPSWNDGPAKKAIVDFVQRVTKEGGPDFVAPEDRIAVFDNDGTLWSEQPTYSQGAFMMDRLRELAPQHPEWNEKEPFKSALAGDYKAVGKLGARGILELITATHSGMTTDEFETIVKHWLATAKHPRFHRRYTDLVYQPMLEVLVYLRANGFKTYIVSGGGIEFMRPWTEKVYGIPPQQVIGSNIKTKYELIDGKPALVRLPEIDVIADKAEKPVCIEKFIGRKPIAAFGNSDGDLQMLEWTTLHGGPHLGMLVHHTDGKREWAYDKDSHVGKLDKGLTEAPERGWTLIDMKNDWKVIFPFEAK